MIFSVSMRAKLKLFFKSIGNGILGISLEILLTCLFMLAGFAVCLVWWGLFK